MTTSLCGMQLIDDDDAFAVLEGAGRPVFADDTDLWDKLADDRFAQYPAAWPDCPCETRCQHCPEYCLVRHADGRMIMQRLHPATGVPLFDDPSPAARPATG